MTFRQPLLTTRLTVPPVRPGLVMRPHLARRLDAGLAGALSLISAPAGFGKTTLVSQWLTNVERKPQNVEQQPTESSDPGLRSAWLSLNEDDNDPAGFWIYLAAAVERAVPGSGAAALALLQAAEPAPIKAAVAILLNDLANLEHGLVLVLDDYHLIQAQPIHDTLAFLLANLPPATHLVMTTRADPPLPLSRLRVRGQLVEIRAADLLFTQDEVECFLNGTMALALSPEELAVLVTHTEGWIAALQLAALAFGKRAQAGTERNRLITALGDAGHHIVDYLVDEVLSHQPEQVQQFLLHTSILDQFNASLCDAVVGIAQAGQNDPSSCSMLNAQLALQRLERANLFLVPLDAERRWYRYHHLFATCLRERLRATEPDREAELHRRATRWYEEQGMIEQAISHAFAAQDTPTAARLIESLAAWLGAEGRLTRLLELLGRLPDPIVRARPSLCLIYARTLMLNGQPDAVERYLRFVEEAAEDAESANTRALRGGAAAIRASLSSLSGDPQRTIASARQALELLPTDDRRQRSVVAKVMGIAHLMTGALDEGAAALEAAIHLGRQSGNTQVAMSALAHLTEAALIQGRLRQVAQLCREALAPVASGAVAPASPARCLVEIAFGALRREWGDLPGAEGDLRQALELARQSGEVTALANAYLELAALRRSQGDLPTTLQLLNEGIRLLQHPNLAILLRQLLAARARALIEHGDIVAGERWAQEWRLSTAGAPGYLGEIEHTVFARLLIAQGHTADAITLLGRMEAAAAAGGRGGRQIELLILLAIARVRAGQPEEAQKVLGSALALAAPEGYLRTFVDEGPGVAALLEQMQDKDSRMKPYIVQLRSAFPLAARSPQPLAEPLTEREREVLGLLAAGATNQAIADALIISLGTVKAHLSHILGKLDVRNRTAAVLRAQQLGLLPKSSPE